MGSETVECFLTLNDFECFLEYDKYVFTLFSNWKDPLGLVCYDCISSSSESSNCYDGRYICKGKNTCLMWKAKDVFSFENGSFKITN